MKTIPISSLEIKSEVIHRFWSHVAKTSDLFSCWLWQAAKRGGYGRFWIGSRRFNAHRVAWFLTNGSIPDEKIICHRCNTPSCVRPSHLYAGNARDNQLDALKAGTQSWQKLSVNQVKEIKRRLKAGEIQAQIAKDYPIDRSTISCISTDKSWSHI